jgi:hypothetical protein
VGCRHMACATWPLEMLPSGMLITSLWQNSNDCLHCYVHAGTTAIVPLTVSQTDSPVQKLTELGVLNRHAHHVLQ